MPKRSHGELHGTIDWDTYHSFVLIDPGIGMEFCICFILHFLQRCEALFRAFGFIIVAARGQADKHQHKESEKKKEEHDSEPGAERDWHAIHYGRWARGSHINLLAAVIRSDADRAQGRAKFAPPASGR